MHRIPGSRRRERNRWRKLRLLVAIGLLPVSAQAATYYVSRATGDDGDDGSTPALAFQTLDHVNTLALQPGDEVRLLCGERWRVDPLVVTRSGTAGSPIVFTSHPLGCADRPVLSGAQPISGWASAGTDLWLADLDLGANAGRFPEGLSQLFRGAGRLPFGRWPNPDAGDGYAVIDAQPQPNRLTDAALPAVDWTEAVAHVKGIRWYMMNREVTSDLGSTLVLGDALSCIGTPDCAGWGYFLSSHPATLDREGEWFYDPSTNTVLLYSTLGAPADGEIEGSAIRTAASDFSGGIEIGRHLQEHVAWVTIENLRIERWPDAGITYPVNLEADENHDLVLRDLEIVDPESTGLRLVTWVWNAAAHGNGPNGWRGGRNLLVENITVSGPNHFGIDTFAVDSTFVGNRIEDVGRIGSLVRSGLGCGFTGTNCTENGDGFRLRHDPGAPDHTARDELIEGNVLERIGMNGIDVFGRFVTVQENVIREPCITKGDCGAIRTFGRDSLAATPVHDVVIDHNVFDTIQGNTDGCHPTFGAELGFGVYVDHFSRDVTVSANTVTGATWVGVLFQDSTGGASGNVLYDNGRTQWGSQMDLRGAVTEVSLGGNVLFSLGVDRWTLSLDAASQLVASDQQRFMSPWRDLQILLGGSALDLAGWQTGTGFDGASTDHWYTLGSGDPPLSTLLVNDADTAQLLDPGPGAWVDLDQQSVSPPVSVPAFSSLVLIRGEEEIFRDGFESGDTTGWSQSAP